MAAAFSRHGRGMVATAAGRRLADRAVTILRLVEDTRAEIAAERDAVRGAVSLGVPPTAGEVIAGPLIERFQRDYPQVTIRVVPAFSGYLLDMLQRGELDLAVMYETPATRPVRSEPLISETLFLIGSRSTALAVDRPVAFADLTALAMILPGPQHGLRMLLEDAAQRAEMALRVTVEAESLQTLKDLVSRGLGHTVLPLAAVHGEMRSGALRAAPITAPALTRKLVLARSIVRPTSNAARIFADTLKAETAAMVRSGIWQGDLLTAHAPPS